MADEELTGHLQHISLDLATAPAPLPDAFSERILTNNLLYHNMFDDLSPASLLRLSRTCRTAHASVNAYIASTFNINKLLLRYFPDPIAFRSLQARTAMLISGSTALQLFNRLIYPESNLDLYIHDGYREEVGRWLLAQGYLYCPDLVQDPDFDIEVKTKQQRLDFSTCYSAPEMMSVLTFKKSPATDTETELIVQVMVSFSHSPLMQSIFRFHSTVVMNVIAWDRAYCLYPHATLEPPRVSFFLRLPCTRDQKFVDKYTARGWRFSNEFKLGTADGPRLFPYYRWIGDGHSWVIELDTTMVFPPPPSLEPFWWKPSRHRLKFWAVRDDGPWADSYAELNPDFVGGGLLNTHYAAPTDFRHTPAVFRTNLDCTGLLRRVTDIWDGDSQKEENHQSEDDQW